MIEAHGGTFHFGEPAALAASELPSDSSPLPARSPQYSVRIRLRCFERSSSETPYIGVLASGVWPAASIAVAAMSMFAVSRESTELRRTFGFPGQRMKSGTRTESR